MVFPSREGRRPNRPRIERGGETAAPRDDCATCNSIPPRGHRAAFTLIELAAATALAALLLAVVSGVLVNLSQEQKRVLDEAPQDRATATVRQFRRDLANARRFVLEEGRLTLVGYGGSDFQTAAPTLRPTEVSYEVEAIAGRSWLIRTEAHLDSASLHNWRSELVSAGITAIDLRPHKDQAEEEAQEDGEAAEDLPMYREGRISAAMRLVLTGQGGAPLADLVIHLHPGEN